jgi:hypothetical protein
MNVSTVNVNVILLLKTLLAQHTTLNYSFHIATTCNITVTTLNSIRIEGEDLNTW